MFQRQKRSSPKPIYQDEDSSANSNNELFVVERVGRGGGSGSSCCREAIDTNKSNDPHSIKSKSEFHQQWEKPRHYPNACFPCICEKSRRWASHRMAQQHQSRRPSTTFVIGTTIIIALFITFLRQFDAYVREYQGPLDHFASDLSKLYYGMFCPPFSSENSGSSSSSRSTSQFVNKSSWNCVSIKSTEEDYKRDLMMPRIFMIGARGEDEDTFDAWMTALHQYYFVENDGSTSQPQHVLNLERINTLGMSNKYALSGGALWNSTLISDSRQSNLSAEGLSSTNTKSNRSNYLCRKMKWEHRLFAVYQTIFSHLLASYPNDSGFVVIEDDAVLNHPEAFVEEVCKARNENMEFYSLYQSPSQRRGKLLSPSCIYIHGTVAFYIQRSFMQKIINERRREWFCRFPIDMYISILGPWYATTREVVGHFGAGRVGSVGESFFLVPEA